MKYPTIRTIYFLGFMVCSLMLSFALYLEYIQGLLPCPLCQLQRIALIIIGLLFLSALMFKPSRISTKVFAFFITLFCVIGALLAGRQIYLQHLPSGSVPGTCVPGLSYLFSMLPFHEAIKTAIQGSSDCAEIVWQFLGLNMAKWTFIAFIFLALTAIWQIKRIKQ
ncbi:MAG: disulfide bond formation protein B [Legionellales bacterium]|nr:disulfide bond formation protein B [Legionellales bacterium]|tara:strand:- start:265 stop:762 length:498 start_codon:yes stop_codon:yes gene_type:complete